MISSKETRTSGLLLMISVLLIAGNSRAASVRNFVLNHTGGPANNAKLLSNGNLYCSESAKIGYLYASDAAANTFTNSGGVFDVDGTLFVGGDDGVGGNGAYIQNAGELNVRHRLAVAPFAGSTGLVRISAGCVNVSGTLQIGAAGVVDLAGGDLLFGGETPENLEVQLLGYISSGRVIAEGGLGMVGYEYDAAKEQMRVYATVSPVELWFREFGLATNNIDYASDPDGDGANNMLEWALGGNPTNSYDQGLAPAFSMLGGVVIYTYPSNSLAYELTYHVQSAANLVDGNWTNVGNVVGMAPYTENTNFWAVTNEFLELNDTAQFFRLKIELK